MKQFAIIGLGAFGLRMLEELSELTKEIVIIDKDRDIIEKHKDKASAAYITDAINEDALRKTIPPSIDAVIVDLGGKIELSLMATAYLKKMNIEHILVKAQSDEHGEILQALGATRVIYPDKEAAQHIAPLLASAFLFNYLPISDSFALAEVGVNENCVGKSITELNLRKNYRLNLVAYRKKGNRNFIFLSDLEYRFMDDDILLIAGEELDIIGFSSYSKRKEASFLGNVFDRLLSRNTK